MKYVIPMLRSIVDNASLICVDGSSASGGGDLITDGYCMDGNTPNNSECYTGSSAETGGPSCFSGVSVSGGPGACVGGAGDSNQEYAQAPNECGTGHILGVGDVTCSNGSSPAT